MGGGISKIFDITKKDYLIKESNNKYENNKNYNFRRDTSESDFYSGPNGQVLPAKYKQWIGVNRRNHFIKNARNNKLKNAINQLYRPGSFIGDGGTASVLKFEKRTGLNVGHNGNSHYQKATEMKRYIENKVMKEQLTNKERKLANRLVKKLRSAIVEWRYGI
jgi:hypothetical protein